MYIFLWIIVNFMITQFGDMGFESPAYWVVQAVFIVGGFLKEKES